MVQRTAFYPLRGGMDLITPPVELNPGRAIAGLNYEPFERGYRRTDGYERFDGQPKPSAASYWVLNFENGTAAINAGDSVTGLDSGAAATALLDGVLESGSYGGGDATGYVVLTGAQAATISDSFLTAGAMPSGYTLTRAGNGTYLDVNGDLQTATTNTARWHHYWTGAAWAVAGLLNEDGRTNRLRNNTMVGAVAGTPGTLPTTWSITGLLGLTQEIVGTGTEDNIEYIDIRLSGSPSSSGTIRLSLENASLLFTSINRSWALSSFLRLAAGDWTNFTAATSLAITVINTSAAISEIASQGLTSLVTSAALGRQRYGITHTASGADASYVIPRLIFGVTSGQAVDVTLRIGLPQIEITEEISSPVRTAGASVFRPSDILTRSVPSPIVANVQAVRLDLQSSTQITSLIEGVPITSSYQVLQSPSPLRSLGFVDPEANESEDFIFEAGESIQANLVAVADAVGPATARGAADAEDDATWHQLAIETARDLIAEVPGSGPVRGVWVFDGEVYAFRDNASGSLGVMWKATPTGWQQQNMGWSMSFDTGSTEFIEDETITGSLSGATAVVRRYVVTSGDFGAGNDAAGRLSLSGLNGTFVVGDVLSGGGVATVTAAPLAHTLNPGGQYRFVNHNFFGLSDRKRMYFVNGVNKAVEWDGFALTTINTGLASGLDRPVHIAVHQNALFLGFRGGSLQNSAVGEPTSLTAVTGSLEITLGADITSLLSGIAGVLPLFGSDKISVLYGADSDEYALTEFATDAGAYEHSVQMVGSPIFCDARGLRSLVQSDTFGNFVRGSISRDVEPLFKFKLGSGARPAASLRVRAKDQYRLFWNDGPTGVTVYLGRDVPEIMPFELLHAPTCMCSGEDEDGNEILLMGSDNGFVYQLDSGTSFDGEAVRAYVRFPFNHLGSPTQNKRWHKATVEIDAAPTTTVGFTTEFSYGDPDHPAAAEQSLQVFSVAGGGGFWEEASWDQFFWSSPAVGLAQAHMAGKGQNMSLTIFSEQTYEEPHAVTGVTLHFSYRGMVR